MKIIQCIFFFVFVWTTESTDAVNFISKPVKRLGVVLDELTNVSAGAVKLALQAMDTGIKAGVETRNIINDRFTQIIEDFRKKMAEGIPELKIPPLEPLTLGHIDVNINHEIGKINGTMDNVVIQNLSQFKLEYIDVKATQFLVGVIISIPTIEIQGNYNISGEIGDMFNIFGEGPFNLIINGIRAGINIKLHFNTGHFSVRDLTLSLSIESLKSNFENLMGGGELCSLFNKVISDLAPEALDSLWPEVEPAISKKIMKMIDEKLALVNVNDILCAFITSFCKS